MRDPARLPDGDGVAFVLDSGSADGDGVAFVLDSGSAARACSGRMTVDRRDKLADEPFEVQPTRDKVLVRFRGRLVRTLTGRDADEMRAALARSDPGCGPAPGRAQDG